MSEVKITESNFEKEVLESDIPVVVDFYADWCGPCKMVAPILEEISQEYEGKVKIGKVNTDEEMGLAMQFKINAIPAILCFKGGKLTDQLIGYHEKADIVNLFN